MRRLLILITVSLLAASLAWSQTKIGGTAKVGGTAKTAVGAGAAPRAIVFNGSTQYARVTLPNSAPWNSLGAFQVIQRYRSTTSASGDIWMFFQPTGELEWIFLKAGATRHDFEENRDNLDIFHTPNSVTNVVSKIQYDPVGTRWAYESWTVSGGTCSNYVSNTTTLTTTTNWNMGNWTFTIGANGFGTLNTDPHVDWVAIKEGVDAMGSGNCPGAEPPAATYLGLWKFDSDNGNDTSGNGLHLTLTGSPTFENTP